MTSPLVQAIEDMEKEHKSRRDFAKEYDFQESEHRNDSILYILDKIKQLALAHDKELAGRIVALLEAKSKLAHENGEKEFATAQKMTDEKGRKLFGKLASHYYGARDAYADAITIVRQQLGEEK